MTTQAEPTQADALGAAFLRDQIASMLDDGFAPRDEDLENTDGYLNELEAMIGGAWHDEDIEHGWVEACGEAGPIEIKITCQYSEDPKAEIDITWDCKEVEPRITAIDLMNDWKVNLERCEAVIDAEGLAWIDHSR